MPNFVLRMDASVEIGMLEAMLEDISRKNGFGGCRERDTARIVCDPLNDGFHYYLLRGEVQSRGPSSAGAR